ncbi:MAG: glycosyltransferase [Lachnospiraceae bacterium]|nr:glycosyltransferase [Lachnospiraceae bacterium]
MNILFVGSEAQQMPGIIFAFGRMGHQVEMYEKPVEEMEGNEELEAQLETYLKRIKFDFILSNVFSREVARVTNRLGIKYAVWCMDSPSFPAWVPEAEYDNCYVFYFDYREYELKKQSGFKNVYHMPLAADVAWSGQLVITDDDIKKYGCDMSFVGAMYTNSLYDRALEHFSADMQDAFSELIEQSAFVWDGQDRLHMPPELVQEVRQKCPQIFYPCDMPDEYFLRTCLLGRKLTNVERTLLMELLSEQFDIHLYTRDTEIVPEGVRRFPEIPALKGAPKVFYSSKINLNITLRSIASGVPARVFDIMSVGGFVLSNWQEEIPELFVEGKEIVTYKTPEELVDKADYYLKHDNERIRIAVGGYQKVKEHYTWEHRLERIISVVQGRG